MHTFTDQAIMIRLMVVHNRPLLELDVVPAGGARLGAANSTVATPSKNQQIVTQGVIGKAWHSVS